MKGIYRFSCKKNAKKLPKNTIINIKLPRSNSPIFDFSPMQHRSPIETRPHSYTIYTMSTHVFGISGVLFHGGGGLVDYIVKMVILTPKSQRLSNIKKYFCQILIVYYQAIKNTKTFCINQKVTFGADLGAYFLSKRDSSFSVSLLIEIVYFGVYYIIPVGFSLFWNFWTVVSNF